MKLRINPSATLFVAITIASGIIVLLGYFVNALTGARLALLQGAATLSAVVLLVGVVNLARVHWRRFKTKQKGGMYSLVLLVALIVTVVTVGFAIGFFGANNPISLWIYSYIQVPIETSLMALLAVLLVYAVARMLNRQVNAYSLLFIGALVMALLSSVTTPFFDLPALRERIADGLGMTTIAGARGILLGVALGTIATGIRILMGADRPYGE